MARTIEEELSIDEVRRLAAGKVTSTMLELVLDLGVFQKLEGRSLSSEELGHELGMPATSARMLTQFLCREGLLILREGRLSNAPVAEKFLTGDSYLLNEIRGILRLNIPIEAIRKRLFNPPVLHWYQLREQGAITDPALLINQPERWLQTLFEKNHEGRLQWGEYLAQRYDFSRHRVLLDVGGSTGGYCMAIRRTNPQLRCIVFDLPEAQELVNKHIAAAGETDHISFVAGSFFTDDLPKGADVALVSQIVHNWTREDGLLILRKVFDALEPGGSILVKEFFFNDDWTGPMEAVFEAFVLLGQEGKSGWQPSYSDVEHMLSETGFADFERRHGVVIGRKREI